MGNTNSGGGGDPFTDFLNNLAHDIGNISSQFGGIIKGIGKDVYSGFINGLTNAAIQTFNALLKAGDIIVEFGQWVIHKLSNLLLDSLNFVKDMLKFYIGDQIESWVSGMISSFGSVMNDVAHYINIGKSAMNPQDIWQNLFNLGGDSLANHPNIQSMVSNNFGTITTIPNAPVLLPGQTFVRTTADTIPLFVNNGRFTERVFVALVDGLSFAKYYVPNQATDIYDTLYQDHVFGNAVSNSLLIDTAVEQDFVDYMTFVQTPPVLIGEYTQSFLDRSLNSDGDLQHSIQSWVVNMFGYGPGDPLYNSMVFERTGVYPVTTPKKPLDTKYLFPATDPIVHIISGLSTNYTQTTNYYAAKLAAITPHSFAYIRGVFNDVYFQPNWVSYGIPPLPTTDNIVGRLAYFYKYVLNVDNVPGLNGFGYRITSPAIDTVMAYFYEVTGVNYVYGAPTPIPPSTIQPYIQPYWGTDVKGRIATNMKFRDHLVMENLYNGTISPWYRIHFINDYDPAFYALNRGTDVRNLFIDLDTIVAAPVYSCANVLNDITSTTAMLKLMYETDIPLCQVFIDGIHAAIDNTVQYIDNSYVSIAPITPGEIQTEIANNITLVYAGANHVSNHTLYQYEDPPNKWIAASDPNIIDLLYYSQFGFNTIDYKNARLTQNKTTDTISGIRHPSVYLTLANAFGLTFDLDTGRFTHPTKRYEMWYKAIDLGHEPLGGYLWRSVNLKTGVMLTKQSFDSRPLDDMFDGPLGFREKYIVYKYLETLGPYMNPIYAAKFNDLAVSVITNTLYVSSSPTDIVIYPNSGPYIDTQTYFPTYIHYITSNFTYADQRISFNMSRLSNRNTSGYVWNEAEQYYAASTPTGTLAVNTGTYNPNTLLDLSLMTNALNMPAIGTIFNDDSFVSYIQWITNNLTYNDQQKTFLALGQLGYLGTYTSVLLDEAAAYYTAQTPTGTLVGIMAYNTPIVTRNEPVVHQSDSMGFMLEIAKRQNILEMHKWSPYASVIAAANVGDFATYPSGYFGDFFGAESYIYKNIKSIPHRVTGTGYTYTIANTTITQATVSDNIRNSTTLAEKRDAVFNHIISEFTSTGKIDLSGIFTTLIPLAAGDFINAFEGVGTSVTNAVNGASGILTNVTNLGNLTVLVAGLVNYPEGFVFMQKAGYDMVIKMKGKRMLRVFRPRPIKSVKIDYPVVIPTKTFRTKI